MTPPRPVPASILLCSPAHTRKLSLGCPSLDRFLGGGIDHGGITEVAGEAGSGKTQLALQLMLHVQLPHGRGGLGGGAVYLHSDHASYVPALNRLRTLAEAFARAHAALGATVDRLMDQVSVVQIDDVDTLASVLQHDVPAFLAEKQVRLVVLDSIGALFRHAGDDAGRSRASQQAERAQQLFAVAARLKSLSDRFNVAVVVTNQVTDKPLSASGLASAPAYERGACRLADGASVRVPALGVGWAHCVNTRLILTRHEVSVPGAPSAASPVVVGGLGAKRKHSSLEWSDDVRVGGWEESSQAYCSPSTSTTRTAHIAWSPRLPGRSMRFEVRDDGLHGIAS
ncbi:hypothetical protein AB1Y20_003002 [Prymnesium parvum]|uniref:RecA family profile 1 domain-containing protein n=1 Tax=Prymnesium parvum TaxID=97485 RepID=A0AB34J9K1_PRYPA